MSKLPISCAVSERPEGFPGAAVQPNSMATNEPTGDFQTPNAGPAWDEAFLRVEGYLRAYGLESHVLLNQITAEIIQEARRRIEGVQLGIP